MRSTAATLLLLLGAAAALAACGVSEETKVRAVAQEFRRAIDAGDGERACRLLTARARDAIRDCPANVASVDSGVAGSGAITISADRATIAIRPGAERGAAAGSEPATTLVKVDGAWRVDAVARRDESTTSARASAYARCWRAAGARIATSARDLTFAAADMPVIAVREDRVSAKGGDWRIFYALPEGGRDPGLEEVIANPGAAAAVAYVRDAARKPAVVARARSCTSGA